MKKEKTYRINTERQAIKESIWMWHWLYLNPLKNKYDYIYSLSKESQRNCLCACNSACACCQYYLDFLDTKSDSTCRIYEGKCPLKKKSICAFANGISAFALWMDEVDCKKNARKILKTLLKYWKEKNWKLKLIDNIIKEIK